MLITRDEPEDSYLPHVIDFPQGFRRNVPERSHLVRVSMLGFGNHAVVEFAEVGLHGSDLGELEAQGRGGDKQTRKEDDRSHRMGQILPSSVWKFAGGRLTSSSRDLGTLGKLESIWFRPELAFFEASAAISGASCAS
jgi:hypothetical protein